MTTDERRAARFTDCLALICLENPDVPLEVMADILIAQAEQIRKAAAEGVVS